jgi:ubiquinone/menaquinone biosynthesis C-methylase UbiE
MTNPIVLIGTMGDSATPTPTERVYDNKTHAANYEVSTGGCTRDLARHIITLAGPIISGSVIHDNACGPGIVAQEIVGRDVLAQSPPDPNFNLTIRCTDRSEAMIDITKEGYSGCESANSMRESFPNVNVNMHVSPAERLPFPDNTFTHSFTNCGILHFEDSLAGTREILRTLKPGATAVVTSWKDLKAFEVVRKAQRACGHQEPLFRPPVDEKWFRAETMEDVLKDAGFRDVKVLTNTVHVAGKDVKDLCGHILMLMSRYREKWDGEQQAAFEKQLHYAVEKVAVPIERSNAEGRGMEQLIGIPMVALVGIARK